jgi:hypothetical protein
MFEVFSCQKWGEKKCQNYHIEIFGFHSVARNIRRWLKICMDCAGTIPNLISSPCIGEGPLSTGLSMIWDLCLRPKAAVREQNHGRAYSQVGPFPT